MESTVYDVAKGTATQGVQTQLNGVIAMSKKFLVSGGTSSGQSCTWGLYVSAPGISTTAPYSGLLIVSKGNNVPSGASQCPTLASGGSGSSIPDDTKPGDVLSVGGAPASFLMSTCGGNFGDTTIPQRQLGQVNCVVKTGTATYPTAATLSSSQVYQLASQNDAEFYNAWSSVLVVLKDVTAYNQSAVGTDPVGAYGNMHLDPSGAIVGDKIYYVKNSSSTCEQAPVFTGLNFSKILGFVTLDYCQWTLQARTRCSSYSPASEDCAGLVCN